MNPIQHYHHVYAGGYWKPGLEQHVKALKESGLLKEIDYIRIGLVGNPLARDSVKGFLQKEGVPFSVIAEADTGWEQVTLTQLHEDAKSLPSFRALYTHSKGSSSSNNLTEPWREDMTLHNVENWREAVAYLDEYDMSGIYWIYGLEFYAGNFWWANSSYLATLPVPSTETRHEAESWIRAVRPNFYCMKWGMPQAKLPRVNLYDKENNSMKVTFRCDGRILEYKPGHIYETNLTPALEVLLTNGSNLVLIDPPSLYVPEPAPKPEPPKEEASDGENTNLSEESRPNNGSHTGNRGPKKSTERTSGSEETSTEV